MDRYIRLLLIILVPSLAALGTYLFLKRAFYAPVNPNDTVKKLVEIEADKNFGDICDKLYSAGVIRYRWAFNLLARVRKVDTAIKAGEYELSPSMPPRAILDKLIKGDVYPRFVTVTPGESIWQIGDSVEKAGLMSKKDFNKALVDRALLARAGIQGDSFEGYLYPETYKFSRPITAWDIIVRMIEEGEKHWPEEYTKRADDLHLTRHEILTLASIIVKESGDTDEEPIISSVFHNRLNQGMRLQSDPTVIYGIPNFKGTLTREDLQTPTPYNTYTNFGLPPGPIGNPNDAAIRAALYPAQTSYLFFVAIGDSSGKHSFATTLQEHNDNVRRYHKEMAAEAAASIPPAVVTQAKAANAAQAANQLFPPGHK